MKKMGPLEDIMGMIPGMSKFSGKNIPVPDQKQLNRTEAIINSMTKKERIRPDILDASRRRRIARGSGTSIQDVNELLKKFEVMKKMTKNMAKKMKSNKMLQGFPF